jgi:hypothetical protein
MRTEVGTEEEIEATTEEVEADQATSTENTEEEVTVQAEADLMDLNISFIQHLSISKL